MKRFHVHVAVHDLEKSIRFYKAMFDAEPTVRRSDYAKWQLEDPRLNFAISQRGAKAGVDHLGIQAENAEELEALRSQLAQADVAITDQKNATCCYAKSDKHWTIDPQGIAWESFHTLESAPRYGDDLRSDTRLQVREAKAACCAPATA
jgi:catechol 2,3-dioxygenase-like lactoylglutathione lyase family enzyme